MYTDQTITMCHKSSVTMNIKSALEICMEEDAMNRCSYVLVGVESKLRDGLQNFEFYTSMAGRVCYWKCTLHAWTARPKYPALHQRINVPAEAAYLHFGNTVTPPKHRLSARTLFFVSCLLSVLQRELGQRSHRSFRQPSL